MTAAQAPPAATGTAPAATGTAPAATGTAGRSELFLSSGLLFFSSARRVLGGIGGGGGYRFHASQRLSLYVEGKYLTYLGQVGAVDAGAAYSLKLGNWEPSFGAQALFTFGDALRVVTVTDPQRPPALAWAAQVRLQPIRFLHDPFTVSALLADIGLGSDAGSLAIAFGLTLLQIGYRF